MTHQKTDPFFRSLAIGAPLATVLGVAALLGCAPKPEAMDLSQDAEPEVVSPAPKPAPKPIAPEGWKTTGTNGVYWKWCDSFDRCDTSKVIGDNGYVQALVWCKEKACGDIYGRVNLIDGNGTVVGWTNDTGYGGAGQRVQLTFDSYQNFSKASLTELNIRG
jgi:hypothetical protein